MGSLDDRAKALVDTWAQRETDGMFIMYPLQDVCKERLTAAIVNEFGPMIADLQNQIARAKKVKA